MRHRVSDGQTLFSIFRAHDLPLASIREMTSGRQGDGRLARIRPGDALTIALGAEGGIERLTLQRDGHEIACWPRASATAAAGGGPDGPAPEDHTISVVVKDSVYRSAIEAGLPPSVPLKLSKILASKVDLQRSTQPGDGLTVIVNGQPELDQGSRTEILAAGLINGRRRFLAVRYTDRRGTTGYYAPDGSSLLLDGRPRSQTGVSFLRAPVQHTRISSRFNMNRIHPILKRRRPHTGVDFAAPAGRRVVATAAGVVAFVGRDGGYGKVVRINHGKRHQTVYAHLARYASRLRRGQRVSQGQTIGFVGSTGLSTGPHVHYELRISGKPVDPMAVAAASTSYEIAAVERPRFEAATRPLLAKLRREMEAH